MMIRAASNRCWTRRHSSDRRSPAGCPTKCGNSQDTGGSVPHAREHKRALMRSMSPGRMQVDSPGAPADITRERPVDDNVSGELAQLTRPAKYPWRRKPGWAPLLRIRGELTVEGPCFGQELQAMATGVSAETGQTVYPGKKMLSTYAIPGTSSSWKRSNPARVIVLGPNWQNDPWADDDLDKPSKWDRLFSL